MRSDEFTVRVLGPAQIGNRAFRSRAADAVLSWAALHSGRAVRLDVCGRELWPDQSGVAAARRARDAARSLAAASPDHVRTKGNLLELTVPPHRIDEHAFRSLVVPGRIDEVVLRPRLEAALRLWRGDPYPALAHVPLVQRRVAGLRELRLLATERLFVLAMDAERDYEVVARLRAAVHQDPDRERLWRLLAVALYLSSRQVEGLEEIAHCRRTFARRGERTSPLLGALQVAMLRGDHDVVRAAA